MVLARDLHKRIQNIQIQIGASTRVAHLEKEISTLTDAVSLLVNKLEKPIQEDTKNPYEDENGNTKKIDREAIPKDNNDEKWKEYLDDNDELDADKILAEDDEEEPDVEEEEDDEEEEYEDDEEEEEDYEWTKEEPPVQEPELVSQVWDKKHLKELSGYKADKEKSIGGVAHEWTSRDDILADNFTVIAKRVIFYINKNYS